MYSNFEEAFVLEARSNCMKWSNKASALSEASLAVTLGPLPSLQTVMSGLTLTSQEKSELFEN
jgi:hypothetical protein